MKTRSQHKMPCSNVRALINEFEPMRYRRTLPLRNKPTGNHFLLTISFRNGSVGRAAMAIDVKENLFTFHRLRNRFRQDRQRFERKARGGRHGDRRLREFIQRVEIGSLAL